MKGTSQFITELITFELYFVLWVAVFNSLQITRSGVLPMVCFRKLSLFFSFPRNRVAFLSMEVNAAPCKCLERACNSIKLMFSRS